MGLKSILLSIALLIFTSAGWGAEDPKSTQSNSVEIEIVVPESEAEERALVERAQQLIQANAQNEIPTQVVIETDQTDSAQSSMRRIAHQVSGANVNRTEIVASNHRTNSAAPYVRTASDYIVTFLRFALVTGGTIHGIIFTHELLDLSLWDQIQMAAPPAMVAGTMSGMFMWKNIPYQNWLDRPISWLNSTAASYTNQPGSRQTITRAGRFMKLFGVNTVYFSMLEFAMMANNISNIHSLGAFALMVAKKAAICTFMQGPGSLAIGGYRILSEARDPSNTERYHLYNKFATAGFSIVATVLTVMSDSQSSIAPPMILALGLSGIGALRYVDRARERFARMNANPCEGLLNQRNLGHTDKQ